MSLGARVVVAAVFGMAGYQEAVRFRRRYGRGPFGWDPITWGIVCCLSFVLGLVLLAIGERIQRNKPMMPSYGQLPDGSPAQGAAVYGYQVPTQQMYAPPPPPYAPADSWIAPAGAALPPPAPVVSPPPLVSMPVAS